MLESMKCVSVCVPLSHLVTGFSTIFPASRPLELSKNSRQWKLKWAAYWLNFKQKGLLEGSGIGWGGRGGKGGGYLNKVTRWGKKMNRKKVGTEDCSHRYSITWYWINIESWLKQKYVEIKPVLLLLQVHISSTHYTSSTHWFLFYTLLMYTQACFQYPIQIHFLHRTLVLLIHTKWCFF